MLLLVQYIDSEFPDYDIVNKSRLLKIKHDKKNIKLVRSESDQSVHRAIVIQESEHEFRLKVVKDMLLKQHRAKRVPKMEWRKKAEGAAITKISSSRVCYSSTDSDTDSEIVVSSKGRKTNSIEVKNEITNSINCSPIHEAQSGSDSCMEFSGSPSIKSTSTPYPGINTSTSTVSQVECTDREVQTRPDRMTKMLEEIVTNGQQVQEEMIAVLKMFEEHKNFPGSPNSSPEIRQMRKRITNSKKNSPDSSDNSSAHKKVIVENAERVRQNILKVLNIFSELESYPVANLYKEKKEKYVSSDEMVSDPVDVTSNDDDSDYVVD
ncbi:uncharacterized protein LOC121735427 [Aricia agestis]|uniref:uncharacterized protein LOC121735427 n=1 Tax=Aricia agestis TaxID=91739 RepID=UPI001C20640A|nr:uncharacterized protein LOC121735427 [Aricia agestis]